MTRASLDTQLGPPAAPGDFVSHSRVAFTTAIIPENVRIPDPGLGNLHTLFPVQLRPQQVGSHCCLQPVAQRCRQLPHCGLVQSGT